MLRNTECLMGVEAVMCALQGICRVIAQPQCRRLAISGLSETRHFTIQARNKMFRSKRLKIQSTKNTARLRNLGEWRAYNLLWAFS